MLAGTKSMPLAAGSRLGPYRIDALLGAGGMGEVYRARDERLERDVAIKVLRPDEATDPDRQRRFAQEARAASGLNHPNIVVVYDVGMEKGIPFIVTELVAGEPLHTLMARGAVPLEKALDLAIQLAGGLAAAHQAGIVHRDIKPANVMVTGEGLVKILDFGLAKPVRKLPGAGLQADSTQGLIVGTASYMSPEQARGEPLDHRTDQFSFGLVVYQMLAGKPAFARGSAISIMAAIAEESAPRLMSANAAVPAPLAWCVDRCLAKDRECRYASTADLRRELEIIRSHLDELAGAAPAAAAAVKPARRVGYFWLAAMVLVGLAAGVLLTGELLIPPSATDLAACHIQPVAVAGEFGRSPAFSNDGKSIAFTAVVNGFRQVFVRDLKATTATQITSAETDCARPFWSVDDSRIYYFGGGTRSSLYASGATGGTPELVAKDASAAAINRPGNQLAYLRTDPDGKEPLSLWFADSGGQPQRFTGRPFDSGRYESGYLAFSPDGKKLGAWLSGWDSNSELWIIEWPQGQAASHMKMVQQAYPFSWMPDSRNVVFGGLAQGSFGADLQMFDTRNGYMRPLTFTSRDALEASVSPDGRRIAFVASEEHFSLMLAPLDGGAPHIFSGTDRDEYDPAWSPSGDQLAYSTNRAGTSQIWLRSLHGVFDRPLITAKDFDLGWVTEISEPSLSPDGRRVAYAVASGAGHALYISAIAGGKPVRLSNEAADEGWPTWNGDGSAIAYLRNRGGGWSLVKADSGGNAPPTVLRDGCLRAPPKWNSAEHSIACMTRDGLTLVSADGKDSRVLSTDHWVVFGWSKDGKLLYGVKITGDRVRQTVSLDASTGAEKILGDLGLVRAARVRGFSVSPDGTSFATSASHPGGDIWILEGFRQPGVLSWLDGGLRSTANGGLKPTAAR
jgi:eukaryotic-like serine/threonine-protein kinase